MQTGIKKTSEVDFYNRIKLNKRLTINKKTYSIQSIKIIQNGVEKNILRNFYLVV